MPGEMNALVHHVRGHHQIRSGAALPEDGTVVPNAPHNSIALGDAEAAELGF